jgi:signal transduction histidine kinase
VTQLLLAVFPLLVPPTLELVTDLRGQDDQPGQLFVGMALVMALALVRTGRLILSEQQAHRELEVARDEALAASEAKSMFLANMSHELRTPLTTVLVAGGLLGETPLDDTQRMLLGKVHRSGSQLQTLVEGLLDLSRIEAGRAVLQKVDFDLHALLAELVDVHRPRAEAKGIGFSAEIDPQLPQHLVGDEKRVFQVLSNLLENAAKFTEAGQVRLTARRADSSGVPGTCTVQFSVTDTGIGIPEEEQESIFESFRQVDGSATRYYQGTGLGLAICRELTELMGGTITVLSDLGVGSTFTVRLPLEPQPGEAPAADPPRASVTA